MPKRTDIRKILLIGSGPIVIGQAAEFDFSGSQAAMALREEGYEVVIVNSNPATIQTDTEMADRVYVEPLNVATIEQILAREKPHGLLAGMGGQTALNLASELAESGALSKHGCELLGTKLESIQKAEDRDLFKKAMESIGEPVPKADVAHSLKEAKDVIARLGLSYPVLVRPAYTLGGTGGGVAYDDAELDEIVGRGLVYSRTRQVLIEESVLGWKEFEYEVMRDGADNCIIICNMENFDAMGIHTGESIVVAPAQTLSDHDHQLLRTAAIRIIRALRIEGGCNVQFAFHHGTGDYRVIEVNPRVSRSSALASKATGYPIARVAAKIAIGMRLDEIPNSVTRTTPASFEPALDYIITKIPRWPFDKFRTVDRRVGTQMKSTGEVMGIGRTFEESLQKAVRSLEIDRWGLEWTKAEKPTDEAIDEELRRPTNERLYFVAQALRQGWDVDRVCAAGAVDPWFVEKIRRIVAAEPGLCADAEDKRAMVARVIETRGVGIQCAELLDALRFAKALGFADGLLAEWWGVTEDDVALARRHLGVVPRFNMVDTCAAEFAASTPYLYSTFEAPSAASKVEEAPRSARRKVVILGGGPIRIGQGIEFDYCVVHAVKELRASRAEDAAGAGFEAIVINNNPETVSTDAGISDKLYFEPLVLENVLDILEREDPDGVILQFGGQTSVNLALPLQAALGRRPWLRTKLLGTSADSMDLAEDRRKFADLMDRLRIPQPKSGTGHSFEEVRDVASKIGYPVLVRPSYVLGGRGMEIVYDEEDLKDYMREAVKASKKHPVLVDKYLTNAVEIDIDCVCDGEDVLVGGIQEHIEEAGVHSGDATAVMPPQSLSAETQDILRLYAKRISKALGVVGLVNFQFAVKDKEVYILEANPRASRTVPFVSKAIGLPLARIATRAILGTLLRDQHVVEPTMPHVAVKAPVFPFLKLPGIDSILTPEMKSTGEVMGLDDDFDAAYFKAMQAAYVRLPLEGTVYLSIRDEDKNKILPVAQKLVDLGFRIVATPGTAAHLREFGVACDTVWRIWEKRSPDAIDLMRRGEIRLVVNTPTLSRGARRDGYMMRRLAVELDIPFLTTLQAATAATHAIARMKKKGLRTTDLAAYHARMHHLKKPTA
ncbi:MAG TPA: carbamoyl-phosphate synthase large subunit [Candidatus Thermoplasmatota archaeon]|nr:carbamoyl-phosphate synthase large subunit [Candidatus Thermoplasmatota archaeon]